MIIESFEQYSPEWWESRAGHPTASCFDKILTPKTQKPSSQAQNYMYTLAAERIAGPQIETYQNAAMARGKEMENEARQLFALSQGIEVKEVGLIYPDEKRLYSCSPDGFWGEGLELKCPLPHTHIGYLLSGILPTEYIMQVQGSMLITAQDHWFFMSYYPGLAPLILRVNRDDKLCATLKVELIEFCEKLDELTEKLRDLN